MQVSKIPKTVFELVQPAVWSLAARLLVLSTHRLGSQTFKPTVSTFYETSIITSLYEALLMSPVLAHLEVRHEMPYPGPVGAPKQVDLWLRPHNGGYPHLIEAGDFSVGKVHRDLGKLKALNPSGSNWFLAFFRDPTYGARDPWSVIQNSFQRANGLDKTLVDASSHFATSFDVYRPNTTPDPFGAALFQAR